METVFQALQKFKNGELFKKLDNHLNKHSGKKQVFPHLADPATENFFLFLLNMKLADLDAHLTSNLAMEVRNPNSKDPIILGGRSLKPGTPQFKINKQNLSYLEAVAEMYVFFSLPENLNLLKSFIEELINQHIGKFWGGSLKQGVFNKALKSFTSEKLMTRLEELKNAIHEFKLTVQKPLEVKPMLDDKPSEPDGDKCMPVMCSTIPERRATPYREPESLADKLAKVKITQYVIACNDYLKHLDEEMNYHNPIKLSFDEVRGMSLDQASHGSNVQLKMAMKKYLIIQDLKNCFANAESPSKSVALFEKKLGQVKKELLFRRLPDSHFKLFLRACGVFCASVLGLTLLGVGAIATGYYAYQSLFSPKRNVTASKLVSKLEGIQHGFYSLKP